MNVIESARLRHVFGGRWARRRSVRIALLLAVTVPPLGLAIPRVTESWGRGGQRDDASTPSGLLETVWRRFEEGRDVGAASIDEFAEWLDGDEGVEALQGVDPAANWSVRADGDSVSVGLVADEAISEEPEWALDVRRAPWAGVDATLAASDLECVLCHARVEGDAAVRVVSGTPYEPGRDARVLFDGAIDHAPDRLDAPDLVGALDASSRRAGVVESARGAVGTEAISALAGGALAETRIDGETSGPVVLIGTPDAPIRLNGDAVIVGDLVLMGEVVGDGALRVFGNVFVPGDVVHRGTGSVRVLVRGSVMVGEIQRPRRGERRAVTGGPDGSFSFLVEAIARFNGAVRAKSGASASVFTLHPDRPAPVLAPDARATAGWRDVQLVLDAPRRTAGPSAPPNATRPWTTLDALFGAAETTLGERLGDRPTGTRLDAMFVVDGAFVAVATGIDAWRAGGASVGSALERDEDADPDQVPPGAVEVRGALIATHAAVHAPAGLTIVDDPDARAAVRLPAVRGLVARLRGPRSSVALESGAGTSEGASRDAALSVDGPPDPDRLPRAFAQTPSRAVAQDRATPR